PFDFDEKTNSPFIRLAKHPNIIITPPRISDAPALIDLLNDGRVVEWLSGPPYPYLQEHADWFLNMIVADSSKAIEHLQQSDASDTRLIEQLPVRYLRELREDGTTVLIGDISIHRLPKDVTALGLPGAQVQDVETLYAENNAKELGDPTILWTIGYFLASTHHGQGIMSDAVNTVISKWAVPRMGVKHIVAHTFDGNAGSRRTLEKNGFVYRET
ncbi:hypothetical protein CYLTODRAFT_317285, partial [Cylindrobasidium torrendii FP15055 ss-10]